MIAVVEKAVMKTEAVKKPSSTIMWKGWWARLMARPWKTRA